MVDLITGRLDWIRIEPPGENSIEFRCRTNECDEAHQVKRGLSGGGHWTIAALSDVLEGFGALLASERELRCIFVSEHSAAELNELTERARDAQDCTEFISRFLEAKSILKAWTQVKTCWKTDDEEAWHRLRRIIVISVSEQHLQENIDAILQLLFDSPAATVRAVLTELALDSIHQVLRGLQVLEHLTTRHIRRVQSRSATALMPAISPPPASGVRRIRELEQISEILSDGINTVFVGGIAGVGKTTVAAQFAAEWNGPVCWIECGLVTSELEALGWIGEFLSIEVNDKSVASLMGRSAARPAAIARLAGKCLAAHGCLLVWDGLDGELGQCLRPVNNAISSSISGGAQIITTQEQCFAVSRSAGSDSVHVGRLDKEIVRKLLADAFPEARVADLEEADKLTQGHPYLVHLLIGSAQRLNLKTSLEIIPKSGESDSLICQIMANLPEDALSLLTELAWLGIPFSNSNVSRLGGATQTIAELSRNYLIIRAGADRYRVHDIVANLIRQRTSEAEALELHQRAALLLQGVENPAWLEVRAMLFHARAASMHDISRQAGFALLNFAMGEGLWVLAHEAAESVVNDPVGAKEWFPYFVLGKCARMRSEPDVALGHFRNAESHAVDTRERDIARYESASALCEMGHREDAEPIYRELTESIDVATKVEAHVALALGANDESSRDLAISSLREAAKIAELAEIKREEADVWHAMGNLLIKSKRLEDARDCLRKAYALRYSLRADESKDVYGWYHLLASILRVELELANPDGARSAAHSLWLFSLLSGNVDWETNAAFAVCCTHPHEGPEVEAAVARLRGTMQGGASPPVVKLSALHGLVLCEWTLGRYELAIESILEMVAISEEHQLDAPAFAHMSYNEEVRHNVAPADFGYVLMLPPGEGEDFVVRIASRVLERRAELAKYAVLHAYMKR